nr:DUF305 domain-containing protein [Kineococcus siccus]
MPTAPGEQSVDVGFARDMSTHHAQAVAMAFDALQTAPTPEVRQLALDMVGTQQNQVGRLQQLLVVWGRPLAGSTPVMGWMTGTDAHDRHLAAQASTGSTLMPGMATGAELARLQSEDGAVFEVHFLQLVLRHHQGGIEMAEVGADRATTPEVRDLARAIAASQEGEVAVLTELLADRGAQPLPAP